MCFLSVWERYLWSRLLSSFLFMIGCFYALYVLIDYANQLSAFRQSATKIAWSQLFFYYLYEFSHRAEVLIPVGLLLTTMRVLLDLNHSRELVALQCGGISPQKLLRPFLVWAVICMALLYANDQWMVPHSVSQVKMLHPKKRVIPKKDVIVQHLPLLDGSFLIYQDFEQEEERFFDVYWVRSIDEVWKMKYLYPRSSPPSGEFVDILQRHPQKGISLIESHSILLLPNLTIDQDKLKEAAMTPSLQSFSTLWNRLPAWNKTLIPREAQVATAFYQKVTLPWLCLIAVLLPVPLCMRFSRSLPVFLIYALHVFLFIAFYLFLDSLAVLTKRQFVAPYILVLPPLVVIGILLKCVFPFFTMKKLFKEIK